MLKISLVVSIFLFFSNVTHCQEVAKKEKSLITIYTYGLFAFSDNDCEIALQEKYGFQTIVKAGCVVSHMQVIRWEGHNRRSERKLNRIHGRNWRYKFDEEKRSCRN